MPTATPAQQAAYAEAKDYRMPFGTYRGQTLDDIARTDSGLRYLDFMRGELDPERVGQHSGFGSSQRREVRRMLAAYLDHPTIAQDLERI